MADPYVSATQQLVAEVFVSDLTRSIEFYRRFGFTLLRKEDRFAALEWEGCELFLDERPVDQLARGTQANLRIMVPDVDRYWDLAQEIGVTILSPIGDRYYGLRDFTILDPDGFGLRFGSWLTDRSIS